MGRARSCYFLQQKESRARNSPQKQLTKIDPWVGPYLIDTQADFLKSLETIKALDAYHNSAALLHLTLALHRLYTTAKAEAAALDFDDLIQRTNQLLAATNAEWVQYKLDQGIDHILVDEAQDTSPAQWAIVEALLQEQLSGSERARSFFAVGDLKQSIYSFQGADADLFEEKEAGLGKELARAGAYKNYDLEVSFRSTEPVLQFVDALFEGDAAIGLGQRGVPVHGVAREGAAGTVELWPLAPRPETTATNPWDAPVDTPAEDHPVRKLSHKIASTIARWLDEKRPLLSRSKPLEPGDIMVLVQSRGAIFEGVIRALTQHGVPVAGADRLNLMEDAAIEDLLSYAKFSVSPKDDLSLAEILRSPFFGWDDDDLFELAYTRGEHETLWAALNRRCNEQPLYSAARDEIDAARHTGLRKGPYAFFSHILETGAPSGRKRLYERLGSGARDGVDELLRQALAYENANPRSLRSFINWFEENAGEIKREMDRAGGAVRVMTVHGAKGLEAPIVFLADAHSPPNTRRIGPLFELAAAGESKEKVMLLAGVAAQDTQPTAEARAEGKRKAYEEYRRLLYVAATRAEDELYICGTQSGNTKQPGEKPVEEQSWHALAENAFARLGGELRRTSHLGKFN